MNDTDKLKEGLKVLIAQRLLYESFDKVEGFCDEAMTLFPEIQAIDYECDETANDNPVDFVFLLRSGKILEIHVGKDGIDGNF